MGVSVDMEYVSKLPYHNLFIIHFSFWQVCLFDIVCEVKGKTAECSECGDMGFLSWQKSRITHVTWWYELFARAKKPYHPRDPLSHLLRPTSDMCLKAILVSHTKWTYIKMGLIPHLNKAQKILLGRLPKFYRPLKLIGIYADSKVLFGTW